MKLLRRRPAAMGELGLRLVSNRLAQDAVLPGSIRTAFQRISTRESEPSELTLDILRVMLLDGQRVEDSLTIASKYIPSLDFGSGAAAANVTFDNCWIGTLDVGDIEDARSLPYFLNCAIDRVDGVTGMDAFARERFVRCSVDLFADSAANASSILSLPISDYRRVVISILQRLFLRSGKGRKELAFYRGGLSEVQKQLIPTALDRLRSERIAWPGRSRGTVLWSPNRAMASRVRQILSSPATSRDPVISEK